MKILIIDDEPIVRLALTRAFRPKGHSVSCAENGDLGLKLWRSENPDLVLLDVLMPGKSGFQVLEEMKMRTCLVILMSAFSGAHDGKDLEKARADHFISKPFEDIFAVVSLCEKMSMASVQK